VVIPTADLHTCGFIVCPVDVLSMVSRATSDDFSYRALVRGIARPPLVVVENFPAIEIVFEFSRPQAM
jgi:hypothetical protein